ncbi:hypothetical protein IAT38_007098 [Cryptococcus sp. DSM 104549]
MSSTPTTGVPGDSGPISPTPLSSRLTTQQKLLLAQAVYKYGVSWPAASKALVGHPCCKALAGEGVFSAQECEGMYVELMTGIGVNVPAEGAMKPQAKVHLHLAQTFYIARMQELQTTILSCETRFTHLVSELSSIRSGKLDADIRAEIRSALAKKYGKKLLDSWVPDEGDVRRALEEGEVKEGEVDEVAKKEEEKKTKEEEENRKKEERVKEVKEKEEREKKAAEEAELEEAAQEAEQAAKDAVTEDVEMAVEENEEPAAEAEAEPTEDEPVEDDKAEEADESPKAADEEPEDHPASDPSPLSPAKTPTAAASPGPSNRSDLSPAPSDLSPAPSEHPSPAATGTRSNKRKASTQPRGAPPQKRPGGRRGTAGPPAGSSPAPTASEAAPSDAGEEDEPPATRGRRASKRESLTRSKKAQDSPEAAPSPSVSRRAPSVSSATSGAPGDERRSSRRGTGKGGRGMRDEVVSKSVRDQSAALESVKDDEDEEGGAGEADEDVEMEAKPTRSSRRKSGAARQVTPAEPVSTPVGQKRGTRASARTVRESVENDGEEDVEAKSEDRTPASAAHSHSHSRSRHSLSHPPSQTTPAPTTSRSTRPPKSSQKLLLSLLDTISSHRNGNVFLNPVKKSEAPDYHEVIKRPMDLKTMRVRIKDGQIGSIDEFERDAMLLFANAMMYNQPDSQVYGMAQEMMKDTEGHISHFRNMEHHIAG